jgi:hypothetical protein
MALHISKHPIARQFEISSNLWLLMAARSRTETLAALVKFQDSLHNNDRFVGIGIGIESSPRGLRSSPVTFYCLPDQ